MSPVIADAELINRNFSRVPVASVDDGTLTGFASVLYPNVGELLEHTPTTYEDVSEMLNQVITSAVGENGIGGQMLKLC